MKPNIIIKALVSVTPLETIESCSYAIHYIGEDIRDFLNRVCCIDESNKEQYTVEVEDGGVIMPMFLDYEFLCVFDEPLLDPRAGREGFLLPHSAIIHQIHKATKTLHHAVYLYKLD
jgi:hypothetical protein